MASESPIARFASEKNFSSSFIASFPLPFSRDSASSSFRSRNNRPRKPFKSAFESFVLTYFEKFEEMSAQDSNVVGFFFVFASFFFAHAIMVVVVFPFAKLSCLRVYEVCAPCATVSSCVFIKKRSKIFIGSVLFFFALFFLNIDHNNHHHLTSSLSSKSAFIIADSKKWTNGRAKKYL